LIMVRVQYYYSIFLLCSILSLLTVGCGQNDPPEFEDVNILSELGQPFEIFVGQIIELEVKVKDPDQDELTIEWTARNSKYEEVATVFKTVAKKDKDEKEQKAGDAGTEPNKGPRVHFSAEKADIYAVSVTVGDDSGNQIHNSTFIKVKAVNKPPVLDGTSPITMSPAMPHYVEQEIFLVAQATDSDNDTLIFEWAAKDQENSDAGGLIEESSGASAKFKADTPGSYLISVLVKDNRGGQDREAVVIVINAVAAAEEDADSVPPKP